MSKQSSKQNSAKHAGVAFLIVFALIATLGLTKYLKIQAAIAQSKQFGPPPESVTSIIAQPMEWLRAIDVVGSFSANQGVIVSAEAAGRVSAIKFESGSDVKQGDLLLELDTDVENAKLKAAQVKRDWAERKYARSQELRGSGAVSKDNFDDAKAEAEQTKAEVSSLEATIRRAQIFAPFSGKAGVRKVNLGQYITPGTEVVPIYSLNQLYFDFSVPQNQVAALRIGQKVEATVEGLDGKFIGQVSAFDPQVDINTRSISVRASFDNPTHSLRPGMFARAQLLLGEANMYITVPISSVNYAPFGDTVYVVEPGDVSKPRKIRQQIVKVGEKRGQQVALLGGVNVGEEIVSAAGFKLRPDAMVLTKSELAPENSAQVKVEDN